MIVDHFFIHDRCFAALRPLRQSAQLQERVVLKASAESPSFERLLLELGADAGAAQVPLLLVMAHHAFHHGGIEAQLSELVHDGVTFRIVGVQRPDARLSDTLCAAELEIARFSVEGRTLREIAARARTSEQDARTRLYSAFEKLGVESRVELLQKLVREPKTR